MLVDLENRKDWLVRQLITAGRRHVQRFYRRNFPQADDSRITLMQELEVYLKTFGGVLRLYPDKTEQTCHEVVRGRPLRRRSKMRTLGISTSGHKNITPANMKGCMEKGEFMVWAEDAVAERDTAIREIDAAADVAVKTFIIGRLKEKLNDY